jgi:hypothetical protein
MLAPILPSPTIPSSINRPFPKLPTCSLVWTHTNGGFVPRHAPQLACILASSVERPEFSG